MMNYCRLLMFTFFLMLLCSPAAYATLSPTEELKPTLNQIVELLDSPVLAGEEHKIERRKKIMAVAENAFDFQEMSKLTIGKSWGEISQQQQDTFVTLFTKLLENAYIGKLEGYTGTTVQYQEEKVQGNKAKVSTLVSDKGVEIPMNYIMIQKNSGWKVYDINIEGVSLVRNYREQFQSILRKDQFEGLVKVLEEKNASFAAGGSEQ